MIRSIISLIRIKNTIPFVDEYKFVFINFIYILPRILFSPTDAVVGRCAGHLHVHLRANFWRRVTGIRGS